MAARNQGYTFLQMMIVLTIISLIAGAIVAGQSMIRTAQLQSIVSDTDRYKKAVRMFRDKYFYMPGDMPTATSYWGTDTNCADQTAGANITAKLATCNGNGDGFIGDGTGAATGGATNWYESYRMWQQLGDSDFLSGQYTGALSSRTTNNNLDPGMNMPLSRVPGATYMLLNVGTSVSANVFGLVNVGSCTATTPCTLYKHVLVFGAPVSKYASPYNAALTTSEAEAVDTKFDDGKPGTGNIQSFTPALLSNCATSSVASSATYKISSNGVQCSLIFITGF